VASQSSFQSANSGGWQIQNMKIGDKVTYVEPTGTHEIPALVTAVWSPKCINVVFVSLDETRRDDCGRQTERATSVCDEETAKSMNQHGRFFRL
jgi:hypothetical protein